MFVFFYKKITPVTGLVQGTAGTNCAASTLCFLVTDSKLNSVVFYHFQSCELYNQTLPSTRTEKIDIWGTKGDFKSVTVTGSKNAKAVIPLVASAVDDGAYTLICRSYTLSFCIHQKTLSPFRDTLARPYPSARKWSGLGIRWCCFTLCSNCTRFQFGYKFAITPHGSIKPTDPSLKGVAAETGTIEKAKPCPADKACYTLLGKSTLFMKNLGLAHKN